MKQRSTGRRIRRHREGLAWTQEHLARAAAVLVRTVQRAEEGTLSAETLTAADAHGQRRYRTSIPCARSVARPCTEIARRPPDPGYDVVTLRPR